MGRPLMIPGRDRAATCTHISWKSPPTDMILYGGLGFAPITILICTNLVEIVYNVIMMHPQI